METILAFLEHDKARHIIDHDPTRPGALPLLPTLCALDCQETLDKTNAIGGKTVMSDSIPSPKTEIGSSMEYIAQVIDAQDDMISLWSEKRT
ncbi:hypothetical protein FLONG3_2717 [Fusarium longipes]|uniref:Uncharacterized protein n=1 Tax=Fusarium longipes TaxID=694270 RepID=A0A395T3U6_9HYPO|nr:hypothetical protein FLONG3_2717 [Fusarium longipes]